MTSIPAPSIEAPVLDRVPPFIDELFLDEPEGTVNARGNGHVDTELHVSENGEKNERVTNYTDKELKGFIKSNAEWAHWAYAEGDEDLEAEAWSNLEYWVGVRSSRLNLSDDFKSSILSRWDHYVEYGELLPVKDFVSDESDESRTGEGYLRGRIKSLKEKVSGVLSREEVEADDEETEGNHFSQEASGQGVFKKAGKYVGSVVTEATHKPKHMAKEVNEDYPEDENGQLYLELDDVATGKANEADESTEISRTRHLGRAVMALGRWAGHRHQAGENNWDTLKNETKQVALGKKKAETTEAIESARDVSIGDRIKNRVKRIKNAVILAPVHVQTWIGNRTSGERQEQTETDKRSKKKWVIGAVAVAGALYLNHRNGWVDAMPSFIDGDGVGVDIFGVQLGSGTSNGKKEVVGAASHTARPTKTYEAREQLTPKIVDIQVDANEGTSHIAHDNLGITFDTPAQWHEFNDRTNHLFEGVNGYYWDAPSAEWRIGTPGANVIPQGILDEMQRVAEEIHNRG